MLGDLRGISMALRQGLPESGGLRPGQTISTLIRADANGAPFIKLGEQNIPLPPNAPWSAGQRVQVTLKADATGQHLELSTPPQSPPAAAAPAPALSPENAALIKLLPSLLQKLAPGLPVERAAALLPPQLPATPAATSPLLQLFLGTAAPGASLATVAQWLAAARQSGKLSPAALQAANALLATPDSSDAELLAALKAFAQAPGNEARAAAATADDTPDIRSLLARLLEDDTLRAFLVEQGGDKEFDGAARNLLARLDTGATANLHGLERGYTFFEIPFAWMLGFERAQVHVFPEGGKSPGTRKQAATVVLDLALDTLGALWIQLRRDAATATCDISAESDATRAALEDSREELAQHLKQAGLPAPLVRIHAWRAEDRPERLAALLSPPRPLDVGI